MPFYIARCVNVVSFIGCRFADLSEENMLVTKPYRRERAVAYAAKYAFSQNPLFGNFAGFGGNCTNFVSQCIYAGSCKMNYTKTFGWYFISLDERSPSWTGVEYFYNFMTTNGGVGPFGRQASADELEIGDVVQLAKADGDFYHTLIVVGFDGEEILIAAQTNNAYAKPLSEYEYDIARFIKIEGVRFESVPDEDCYGAVLDGIAIIQGGGGRSLTEPMPQPTPEAQPQPTPEAQPQPTPEAQPQPTTPSEQPAAPEA